MKERKEHMENILELHNLTKSYPKSDFTLDQISFLCHMVRYSGLWGKTARVRRQPSAVF